MDALPDVSCGKPTSSAWSDRNSVASQSKVTVRTYRAAPLRDVGAAHLSVGRALALKDRAQSELRTPAGKSSRYRAGADDRRHRTSARDAVS